MGRNKMILVSDSPELIQGAKTWGQSMGVTVQVCSSHDWQKGMQDPMFRQSLVSEYPTLASGSSPVDSGAKILPFPQGGAPSMNKGSGTDSVLTINQLESHAIESAIHQFNGNLTEAAKALGIGRATLYRKVKQYNIDPSAARKKRAA